MSRTPAVHALGLPCGLPSPWSRRRNAETPSADRRKALVAPDWTSITCQRCKQAIRVATDSVKRDTRYRRTYVAKWPERDAARRALQAAVKNGVMVRGKCERCPSMKTHAHHDDYSKPLDVRWLCRDHHYEVHRELRAAGHDPDHTTKPNP